MSDLAESEDHSGVVPAHIAIIMDGNNRWAKKKHLPSIAGHSAGASTVRRVVEMAAKAGVRVLTLFAFSSENWKRPKSEVDGLMRLFVRSLRKQVKRMNQQGIRLRIMGEISGFSPLLQEEIAKAEALTADNSGMVLVIAANYGGRWDVAQAAKELARQAVLGHINVDDIDETMLANHVQLADLPAPDLLIRTSGEQRISNFLLWQTAYTEFVFLPVLWPDFDQAHFDDAISIYQNRQRRYGGR
ncbi:Ditrans,polycis-undecaprenyl-diphosphate synthase ((2E,6E)-farnesyl-diphosphate specific) [Marinomonas spartinae]|uniref:Ditrans,polycis-undecaprenyl-diphosphate synthase ((2E,6E)-farnesyl-diphosphate specific) n=1 Tax=Marinomonas spartinae TaxID=1792290 RepID=A0A1A8T9G7_9GAMM|nr:isoprenyl transferase [Marinomonas spartinae]SBS27715.1 Ditrans,polycis-undecaprenyl-diphosphate synthase ((2E,6E)-farnesyl-diphosphate specific) [Marinomonas spartinae]SBS28635.1 Ditrans,polycis-undecaprenyl-diphosphate synthase ((2E,6E)-farnesyl-diphosphate specific) [Marinomonas spartinae]